MSQPVVKVSTLVNYLKKKIDQDNYIQRILVAGEISNFTAHRSGHWYFTIKDDASRLSCVMFASSASRSKYIPKDGEQVIIQANTSIFESSGQLQLYVTGIKPDGLGQLHVQFEILKKKLAEEGYFDASHKKPLPIYPMRIGLITGKNTAAREDVVTTLNRRWPIAKLVEINTLVQGNEAASQIISAIKKMEEENVDVLLLVRGGGSIEDLWAFNNEDLAKAIFQTSIPIVTGVGHEVDTTIVDFVADVRAPTPTAACEIATPDQVEVMRTLQSMHQSLIQSVSSSLTIHKNKLQNMKDTNCFRNPYTLIDRKKMNLDYQGQRLSIVTVQLQKQRYNLQKLSENYKTSVQKMIFEMNKKIQNQKNRCEVSINNMMIQKKENVKNAIQLLDAFSPLKILERGYSITSHNGSILTHIDHVKEGESVKVQLSDGYLMTEVLKKEKTNGN